ncbi:MAG TPA: radical SAM protein [Thermoanaerobaculia bacterium]|nr:radical SAM protein [Thermoanaerobaculia bacterium]
MVDRLDCVIIGYNEPGFQAAAAQAREIERYSPLYSELQRSSARYGGRRLPYMDLLNAALADVGGRDPGLNVGFLPALGVAYLTSFLRARGFAVEYVNFYSRDRDQLEALLAEAPRSVAITTTFYLSNDPITEICDTVRRLAPETRIIVGGPHVYNICSSLDAQSAAVVLETTGGDVFVFDSQGEATLAAILGSLRQGGESLGSVPNLFYSPDGGPLRPTPRAVEDNDMDANVVRWDLFPPQFYTPTAQLRTARSCAFECAFCRFPAVGGALKLNRLEVIERQLALLKEGGVDNVIFIDDTFNVPLPRFKDICRMMIRNRFDFRWYSYFRCSNSDDEAFDLMAEAGCRGTFLGIESGDQTVLDAMNKHAQLERYRYGVQRLKERGIVTFASFFVGFPPESERTVANTIEFIEETSPQFYNCGLWYYDDKTPIVQRAEEFGLQGGGFQWRHATMDWKTARDLASHVYRAVRGSIIMPTYSFDFWSIPYLIGEGFTIEQIESFCRMVQPSLLAGLDDDAHDSPDADRRLRAHLANGGAPRALAGASPRASEATG